MKRGSKELIEAFNEIESLIGKDKATPFEMFLQGYFLKQRDLRGYEEE